MASLSNQTMENLNLVNISNPDLPCDIILEIFSKLPTKLVGRCRILSRSWNSQLCAKSFIKKHLIFRQQTIQQENLVLSMTRTNFKLQIITSPTTNDEVSYEKSLSDECDYVVGSCNGLIAATNNFEMNGGRRTMLLNPITLKRVTIQHPIYLVNDDFLPITTISGFGYDSCSDDYKIVQFRTLSLIKFGDRSIKTFIDVYSVRKGVWKRLDDGCYPYGGSVPERYADGAFMNGALHWLISSINGDFSCIAAFDLANEVFSKIPLPKEFIRQLENDVDFESRLQGCNGVVVVGGCLLFVDNLGNGATDIWMMREYGVVDSWVKFRIQSDGIYEWNTIRATLCYVTDGLLLFVTNANDQLAFDLKGGRPRKVVFGGCDAWIFHGMSFVDSLVSPEGPW